MDWHRREKGSRREKGEEIDDVREGLRQSHSQTKAESLGKCECSCIDVHNI